MDYKVNFKTKTMEWKTKYNSLVNHIENDKQSKLYLHRLILKNSDSMLHGFMGAITFYWYSEKSTPYTKSEFFEMYNKLQAQYGSRGTKLPYTMNALNSKSTQVDEEYQVMVLSIYSIVEGENYIYANLNGIKFIEDGAITSYSELVYFYETGSHSFQFLCDAIN